MAIEITGTGRAIPFKRVSNGDLAGKIDTSDEWIRSHTGIGARHIANESTACSDLAVEAAKNALAMAAGFSWPAGFRDFDSFGRAPELSESVRAERDRAAGEYAASLDCIVLATATADYYGCPPTACIVQEQLGAGRAASMDITACCTGFIYGLETAAGLLGISEKRKRALVIGSDVLSKLIDWSDRGTCVLFGDGAGAAVIEKTAAPSSGEERRGLVRSVLGADGSGKESLMFRRGGSREPFKPGEVVDKPTHIEMKGQEVYYFAVKAVTETIEQLLAEEEIDMNKVSRIIPHQANARIVQAAGKRLGIPMEKFFLNIEEYANTSAASIPIALDELNRDGALKQGDLLMTIGFGGGLTYGGNIIIW